MGVLAAGILVAIDPIDKIKQANDAKVQNDVSGMGRAAEAYAIVHNGFYPNESDDLVSSGELKRVPSPPSGYTPTVYVLRNMTGNPPVAIAVSATCVDGATASPTCTGIMIVGQLRSKKFSSTPVWFYESTTGKSCVLTSSAGSENGITNNTSICP